MTAAAAKSAPRIGYFMHFPWGWAWQRPHIAALMLAEQFAVDVHLPADRGDQMVRNPVPPGPRLHPYPSRRAFYGERFKALVGRCDVAWFTAAEGFSLVREGIPERVRVVYDCMDDFLEFPGAAANPVGQVRYYLDEVALMERADLVFASSGTLAARMGERYRPPARIVVVNNAVSVAHGPAPAPREPRRGPELRMAYVGTVAPWFDFAVLLRALEAVPEASCDLIGPHDVRPPVHPRLRSHGPQPHDKAMAMMREADLLLMPRVVNTLTESMNPVKLYEYIHAGVPAVAVAYAETEPFEEYVYLYRSAAQFVNLVKRAAAGRLPPKKDPAAVAAFLAENSWERRGEDWRAAIHALLARPPSRQGAPHLAYQRKQLSRIAEQVDILWRKSRNPGAQLP